MAMAMHMLQFFGVFVQLIKTTLYRGSDGLGLRIARLKNHNATPNSTAHEVSGLCFCIR